MPDTNKMLIDATHPEETRVVVLRGGRVEEFDYESAARKQLRGNIYLAKVTRVEPSLQAAFVDYGGNRHGFLAFNEIHPDYYQIPVADRQALLEEEAAAEAAEEAAAEARAEARARREAARAAAKAARKKAARDAGADADDEDVDEEDNDEIESVDDDDAEITDVYAEATDADDSPPQEASDDENGAPVAESEALKAATPADDTSGGESYSDTPSARTFAEDQGLGREDRLTVELPEPPVQPENVAEQAAAPQPAVAKGAVESEAASIDEAEAADAELDRDAPEPHGLVEEQGVREVDSEPDNETTNGDADESVEQVGSEDALEELPSRPRRRPRSYKIQEVIKRRQVVLVQVVKEERGNKGAALTTYLSLAGRYTVLMPNTARGGGISRKITQPQDRKRLKAIAADLDVPEGMGLIIRTAGAARTKQEIKRDFEYLLRLWESVRELTLQSTAPNLVYEEGNLIKRSIRDLYNKEIEEIIVAGDEADREAKDFMRMLMPSHAKNVIQYQQPEPLFTRFQIERQLNAMFSPYVTLKSGGYLVINQTEALVAIDVNSGKATREFSIEETALVTNCEAAEEIARQLKLRDLAGLIVIDFIDMEEKRNNRTVERRLKETLKHDRARIQVGRISHFGLLEMSRQRLRTGVLEGSTSQCPHCQGTGIIRSVESVALAVLRGLEDAVMAGTRASLTAVTTPTVALYILNKKRDFINDMEARHGLPIAVEGSEKMQGANFSIERGPAPAQHHRRPEKTAVNMDWGFEEADTDIQDEAEEIDAEAEARDDRSEGDNRRRRRRRRRSRRGEREDRDDREMLADETADDAEDSESAARSDRAANGDNEAPEDAPEDARAERDEETENGEDNGHRRRRRRGRRGGRRNRERLAHHAANDDGSESRDDGDDDDEIVSQAAASQTSAPEELSPDAASLTVESRTGVCRTVDTASELAEQPLAEPIAGPSQPSEIVPEPTVSASTAPTSPPALDEPVAAADKHYETAAEPGPDTIPALETESATSSPRTPRGELAAAAPKLERVVVVSPAQTHDTDQQAAANEAPAKKGWWQRRFGG